jgi:hypothetical protein
MKIDTNGKNRLAEVGTGGSPIVLHIVPPAQQTPILRRPAVPEEGRNLGSITNDEAHDHAVALVSTFMAYRHPCD